MRSVLMIVALLVARLVHAATPQAVTDAEKQQLTRLLNEYMGTPYADRGAFVTDVGYFEKHQGSVYADSPHRSEVTVKVDRVTLGPKQRYLSVRATVVVGAFASARTYYVVRTDRGFKLDWAATVGHSTPSIAAFKVQKPSEPVEFRLLATLSTTYWGPFRDTEEANYSIKLTQDYGSFPGTFYGYVGRRSELGRRLFKLLEDGNDHALVMKLMCASKDCAETQVVDIISENWVR